MPGATVSRTLLFNSVDAHIIILVVMIIVVVVVFFGGETHNFPTNRAFPSGIVVGDAVAKMTVASVLFRVAKNTSAKQLNVSLFSHLVKLDT